MKAEEAKQFLKDRTGRSDERMKEEWVFQSLDDMVEFMLQWEEEYATQPTASKWNIVDLLTEICDDCTVNGSHRIKARNILESLNSAKPTDNP